MKVRLVKFFLVAIACIVMQSNGLFAAKPSLSAAQSAETIGDLLKVIKSADSRANFYVYDASRRRYTAPAPNALDYTAKVGGLKQDSEQIDKIKKAIENNRLFKNIDLKRPKPNQRKKIALLKSVLKWVDYYQNFLLYFDHNGKQYYINNPWPSLTINKRKGIPTAIHNTIQKWNPN